MISVASRKSTVLALTRFCLISRRYAAQTTAGRMKESPQTIKDNFAEYWSIFGALAGMAVNTSAICNQKPEEVSVTMSSDLCVVGTCLAVWSYKIAPTNICLVGCHLFNVLTQLNLLRQRMERNRDGKIRVLQPAFHRERRKGEVNPHRHHRHHQAS